MLEDYDSEDQYDEFEGENSHLPYIELIEKDFFRDLKAGRSLNSYLYVPIEFISDNVKAQLDIFLLNEAYVNLFDKNLGIEVLYEDDRLTIVARDNNYKREILNRMMEYYSSIEEYEKCAKIQKRLTECD